MEKIDRMILEAVASGQYTPDDELVRKMAQELLASRSVEVASALGSAMQHERYSL